MSENLVNVVQCLGTKETTADVITASAMERVAATLGVDNPASRDGDPIPAGWHTAFFTPSYRPSSMRADGQSSGVGIMPKVPLPRRRLDGVRNIFHDPLRIGDRATRVSEVADVQINEQAGPKVTLLARNTISTERGLAVVEERDLVWLGAGAPEETGTTPPAMPDDAPWRQVIDPTPVLLFRYSAVRFNSHRIHYDREFATKVEGFPGIVVQATLISQLLLELCRAKVPRARIVSFDYYAVRPVCDTGPFTLAGVPADDGKSAALWVIDQQDVVAVTAAATFA